MSSPLALFAGLSSIHKAKIAKLLEKASKGAIKTDIAYRKRVGLGYKGSLLEEIKGRKSYWHTVTRAPA